ncbi:unnamed protein product [Symbiodinium microadriaticum]|nr:unnamed protein product [Symbiodinium microadriaticum]
MVLNGAEDAFESLNKREQDALLFLATNGGDTKRRKEYSICGKQLPRRCFRDLMGVHDRRLDRIGHLDERYGSTRPSKYAASIDSFLLILYNSLAEPLPTKFVRPHRRFKQQEKTAESEESSGWDSGLEIRSDSGEDEEMATFLTSNSNFLFAMQATAGFTVYNVSTYQDVALPLPVRLGALRLYRRHLVDQYSDRCAIWSLRDISGDVMSRTLTVTSDGADQAKYCIPRDPKLRPAYRTAKAQRPRLKVTELLARVVEDAIRILDARGLPRPECLVLVSDNTVREAKNSNLMAYVSMDVVVRLCKNDLLLDPQSAVDIIADELKRPGIASWLNAEIIVELMRHLPQSYELDEGWGNSGRVKQGDDIFVLVKEYICSTELRQQPMLVLKKEVANMCPLYPLVPDTESPSRSISEKVKEGWIDLASTFEKLHGGNEQVRRAAQYLRDLARGNLAKEVLMPLPFHTSAEMMPAAPVPEYQPHEVVLSVLSPTVPLRAVWHRSRMESSTLRSNTAAILQALGKLGHRQDASSDLKKDEPDSMKTDVTVKEEPGIKMEAAAEQSSLSKKRKLWTSAAEKNLPGDKQFLQEILNYLGQFQDLSGKITEDRLPHPCDTVIDKFQTAESAEMTWRQIKNFLTEWDLTMLGSALKSTFGFARIDQFRVQTPPDGLPSVNDWLTTIISFIFSGNKLDREPIDVCPLPRQEGEEQKYMIKKGFTRFSCLLFLAIVASELDVEAAKELLKPLTGALGNIFYLPITASLNTDSEEYRNKNELDILAELVEKYNSHQANAAIKRWQVSPDMHQAMIGIIIGLDKQSRDLLRSHLDYNKWEESGYSAALLRSKRHMLNNVPKGLEPVWHTEEAWVKSVDQACLFVWLLKQCHVNSQVTESMIAKMEKAYLNGLRDYTQDLEAHVAAKSEKITPEQLAMYQDYVAKHYASAAVLGDSVDLEEAQERVKDAEYRLLCANLATDFHVLHAGAQNEKGLQQVENFMELRMYLSATVPTRRRELDGFARRLAVKEAGPVHHLGFCDLTKFGRLSADRVDEAAAWAKEILDQDPNRSMVFLLAPALASEGVLHGLRGEFRRIEDKFLSLEMELKSVNVLINTDTVHGNRQAYVAYYLVDIAILVCEAVLVAGLDCCRTYPKLMPAWLAVHDTSLGSRQGTLYKAPRSAEKLPDDLNVFAKSALWQDAVTQPGEPLAKGMYQTPESENLLTFEHGRSLTDWKAGRGVMKTASVKYDPNPEGIIDAALTAVPDMKICKFNSATGEMTLPLDVRDKWLRDPVRNPDWRQRLSNLDSVFGHATPAVSGVNPDADLSDPAMKAATTSEPLDKAAAPSPEGQLSEEEFKKKYPVVAATISTAFVGINCYYTNDAVFIMTQHAMKVAGVTDGGSAAKPLFMYAGGTWISAKDWLDKPANQNKAISFELKVMLEKPDSKSEDGTVQTLHELVLSLEKQGLVDLTISGHKVDRPAAVKKGISEDTLDVQHQSYSCYRPNAVALKNAKYQNFAGVVGVKNLSSSPQLELDVAASSNDLASSYEETLLDGPAWMEDVASSSDAALASDHLETLYGPAWMDNYPEPDTLLLDSDEDMSVFNSSENEIDMDELAEISIAAGYPPAWQDWAEAEGSRDSNLMPMLDSIAEVRAPVAPSPMQDDEAVPHVEVEVCAPVAPSPMQDDEVEVLAPVGPSPMQDDEVLAPVGPSPMQDDEVLAPAAPAPGPDDEAVPHDEMPAAAGGMEEIQAIRDAQAVEFGPLPLLGQWLEDAESEVRRYCDENNVEQLGARMKLLVPSHQIPGSFRTTRSDRLAKANQAWMQSTERAAIIARRTGEQI